MIDKCMQNKVNDILDLSKSETFNYELKFRKKRKKIIIEIINWNSWLFYSFS